MNVRDLVGRPVDLSQVAFGVTLRPLFRWLRATRPDLVARTRHEPVAARSEVFVRAVGPFEKAVFLAKMLGSDGGWRVAPPEPSVRSEVPTCAEEMLFAGDLLVTGSLGATLRERIARASCFVVNLEATIGGASHAIAPFLTPDGLRQLIAYEKDPTNDDWVCRIDIDSLRRFVASARRVVVSVANNHALDDGIAGFATTVDHVRRAGIEVVGDARANDGSLVVDIGRHRIGLFALTYGSNRHVAAAPHLHFDGVPYRMSPDRARDIVGRLRARGATHVVALLHWGYEHEHQPAPDQRACADTLFDAGVSAILGHHPHLLQASEARGGRWVSYSLGDFSGGDRTIWSRFGAMVALRFGENAAVSGEVIPVVQTPFWKEPETMLLEDAPALERAVFRRWVGR